MYKIFGLRVSAYGTVIWYYKVENKIRCCYFHKGSLQVIDDVWKLGLQRNNYKKTMDNVPPAFPERSYRDARRRLVNLFFEKGGGGIHAVQHLGGVNIASNNLNQNLNASRPLSIPQSGGKNVKTFGWDHRPFFSFFFFHLTYSRWTSSLPSCLWSQRIFPSLPGSRLTIFLSRCKFSTRTTRQPMVEFYLLTLPRFPLRKKEHKFYFGKNRTHDFRTNRCAAYLLDHSGDERLQKQNPCCCCCCLLLFLTSSVLVANPKQLLYTVMANPARSWSAEQGKKTKKQKDKKFGNDLPPSPPRAARSKKIKTKITRRIYMMPRRYAGLGPSRVRRKIPSTRRLDQWVSLRKILRFRERQQLSQSHCLSLLLARSSRLYLFFFSPRGHEPPRTLRDRLNPHLSL